MKKFQKQDPTAFDKWYQTRKDIEYAFRPTNIFSKRDQSRTGLKVAGSHQFKDWKLRKRGEEPLTFADTAQGLFERGTAFATRVHEGDENIWSRGWTPKEQQVMGKTGGIPSRKRWARKAWSKY
jgi:hypothetical protein